MSELEHTPTSNQPPAAPGAAPWAVYVLYLASLFFGLSAVIGVVIAYMQRREAPDWLATHYTFQIGTFWIGLLLFALAVLTMALYGLGMLIGLAMTVWLIIRCVYGMRQLNLREPIAEPETWLFGWRRDV